MAETGRLKGMLLADTSSPAPDDWQKRTEPDVASPLVLYRCPFLPFRCTKGQQNGSNPRHRAEVENRRIKLVSLGQRDPAPSVRCRHACTPCANARAQLAAENLFLRKAAGARVPRVMSVSALSPVADNGLNQGWPHNKFHQQPANEILCGRRRILRHAKLAP